MAQRALEQRVENLEHRVATVEQILPTLATKTDLAELKVELTSTLRAEWKAGLDAAIAPLATKAEMKAEGEQTRRHFDVVAEGLRAEIRVLADGVAAGQESIAAMRERFEQVDARHEDAMRVLTQHDRRLMRLEE